MVDQERVDRLLDRIGQDVGALTAARAQGQVDDDTVLAAVKYRFITAIEGCSRIAHHIIASEGWPVAESNGGAVRMLGKQGVQDAATAASVATAVGFRNVLVHGYADVDDGKVVRNLEDLDDLVRFVVEVAAWLERQVGQLPPPGGIDS